MPNQILAKKLKVQQKIWFKSMQAHLLDQINYFNQYKKLLYL